MDRNVGGRVVPMGLVYSKYSASQADRTSDIGQKGFLHGDVSQPNKSSLPKELGLT